MLRGEAELLAAIFLNKRTVKQLTTGRLARHSPYIAASLGTLSKKGYITGRQTNGYTVTDKGVRALAEYFPEYIASNKAVYTRLLRKQSIEVARAIKMIEHLGNDYEDKIDSLLKS